MIDTTTYLKEGDLINISQGDKVYATVPKHFLYDNKKGDFTLAKGEVTISGELSYLEGVYVVYKTSYDGGSKGVSNGTSNYYPNGHHVFCEKIGDKNEVKNIKIDFYQSGSFTAMIEGITPIGKATRKWVVNKEEK